MEPQVKNFAEDGGALSFTLEGVEKAFANALRRTILSDIPTIVVQTETYETNQCHIDENTTRLHNEILKHRLSCIPIHSTLLRDTEDAKALPGNYSLVVNVSNDTDNMLYITTHDFRLRDKETNTLLSREEQESLFPGLFPKNVQTQSYIDFARLRPSVGNETSGETLKLHADFSVSTAKQNSMFNVVSKCAYGNTLDTEKSAQAWEKIENKLRKEEESSADIAFQKENFRLLDAQRHFLENSFDFVIETVGVYDNREIVRKACAVLQNKFIDIIQLIDASVMPIFTSETTMENCYDVHLEDEDYTVGKVLEYILYRKYYEIDKSLTFCGFKKFHPHDTKSVIRLALREKQDKSAVLHFVRDACVEAQEIYKTMYSHFK